MNKKNPIVKKLMELDDTISEYFALKYCDSRACSCNDISDVVGPGGRDPLMGLSFVIWKSQEFLQAPDMID
ncbi:hypothetical protein ASZ90_012204 [hydrocarbon metagenome]|uniref:Uncharacterized protein n=1 Tax=hydrocarbon metagenome TaxID=938273 RepID=A0A0W8FB36_9ZZZZ